MKKMSESLVINDEVNAHVATDDHFVVEAMVVDLGVK